ncbi:MAG: DUF4190 domain-containing protein [Actinomycetales bacterium]|nr:DUF4190 domain-containing protein [Actinomycetales bacterium]
MSDSTPPPAAPQPPAQWTGQPGQPYPYVPQPPYNVFAIISLVGAFLLSPVGIVFGHIALSQVKRTGERGREMALAGTIIGYVFTGFWLLYFLFLIAVTIFSIAIPFIVAGTAH